MIVNPVSYIWSDELSCCLSIKGFGHDFTVRCFISEFDVTFHPVLLFFQLQSWKHSLSVYTIIYFHFFWEVMLCHSVLESIMCLIAQNFMQFMRLLCAVKLNTLYFFYFSCAPVDSLPWHYSSLYATQFFSLAHCILFVVVSLIYT